MSRLRCAVLDDYQNVALQCADWSSLHNHIELAVFKSHFERDEDFLEAIGDTEILVVMRERTPIGRSLIERMHNLKLIVTTGMRNASIDVATARAHGITVVVRRV